MDTVTSRNKKAGTAALAAFALALSASPAKAQEAKSKIQDARAQHGQIVTGKFDEKSLNRIVEITSKAEVRESDGWHRVSGSEGVKLDGSQLVDVYVLKKKEMGDIRLGNNPVNMVIDIKCFSDKKSHSAGKPELVRQYVVTTDGTIFPLTKQII